MIFIEKKQSLMVYDICRTKSYFEMVTNAACQFGCTDLLKNTSNIRFRDESLIYSLVLDLSIS